jgi:hypothetical protein
MRIIRAREKQHESDTDKNAAHDEAQRVAWNHEAELFIRERQASQIHVGRCVYIY